MVPFIMHFIALLPAFSNAIPQASLPAASALPNYSGMGGIFGIDSSNPKGMMSTMGGSSQASVMSTGITKKGGKIETDNSGGSGQWKAEYKTEASLANHTIYAPKSPPPGLLPIIVWGNGGCMASGLSFQNFLTEIASHGYVILANGNPGSSSKSSGLLSTLNSMLSGGTKATMLNAAIDWAEKNPTGRYGSLDLSRIAAAGQSCGGLEAYSASYADSRIKQTILFNSGVIDSSKKKLLAGLKAPVAYFLGGPTDIAYLNVSVH